MKSVIGCICSHLDSQELHRGASVQSEASSKGYCGSYQVENKVGSVGYAVILPPQAAIHTIFHVSLLKRYHNPTEVTPAHPPEV